MCVFLFKYWTEIKKKHVKRSIIHYVHINFTSIHSKIKDVGNLKVWINYL